MFTQGVCHHRTPVFTEDTVAGVSCSCWHRSVIYDCLTSYFKQIISATALVYYLNSSTTQQLIIFEGKILDGFLKKNVLQASAQFYLSKANKHNSPCFLVPSLLEASVYIKDISSVVH